MCLFFVSTTLLLSAKAVPGQPGPIDSVKPSDIFIQGLKGAFDAGYAPKDTLQVFTGYSKFEYSDLGTTVVANFWEFKKAVKIWSTTIKGDRSVVFPLNKTRQQTIHPFVGIEEWDFNTVDDADKCMDMLKNPVKFNSNNFRLHTPPREFIQQGTRIFYFYTYPYDFYTDLVTVRDIFMRLMVKPEVVK